MKLMKFPSDWDEMYPEELFAIQVNAYEPGAENAAEHFRFGAFLWWLRKNLTQQQLNKIRKLAEVEEDYGVRDEVLGMINSM
jgi:hypothetical protein